MTCQFPVRGLKKRVLTVKGSGCVALGHPVTSARIGSPTKVTGAWRTPLSNRSGAKCSSGVITPADGVPTTAQSDADALKDEDSRNLARDARTSSGLKLLVVCRAIP
jgi:hypothetical protein